MSVAIPAHLRRIAPYVPGKPIEEAARQTGLGDIIKLASNENPLGPSPRAVEAIRDAAGRVNRYPDGSGHALRQALAARHRFEPAQVVLGNGSTELLELAAKAFLGSGRTAVVAEPAFVMYRIAALAMDAPVVAVPLRDQRHDLEAMAAACGKDAALVYIGNPNNPTGTYVGTEGFVTYFRRVPDHVLTVVDEAYFDYVEEADYPDCLEDLRAGRNVLVLRTFSKIHGLAGLRMGYGVTTAEVASALESVRSPFNTSTLAQAGALAALGDAGHVERSRRENSRCAAMVAAELAKRRVDFVPTVANFFLIRTELRGTDLYEKLLRQGVIVRPMEPYGYQNAVRVSIGAEPENDRFLAALDQVLQEAKGESGGSAVTP